jgi:hypothetical protein
MLEELDMPGPGTYSFHTDGIIEESTGADFRLPMGQPTTSS